VFARSTVRATLNSNSWLVETILAGGWTFFWFQAHFEDKMKPRPSDARDSNSNEQREMRCGMIVGDTAAGERALARIFELDALSHGIGPRKGLSLVSLPSCRADPYAASRRLMNEDGPEHPSRSDRMVTAMSGFRNGGMVEAPPRKMVIGLDRHKHPSPATQNSTRQAAV